MAPTSRIRGLQRVSAQRTRQRRGPARLAVNATLVPRQARERERVLRLQDAARALEEGARPPSPKASVCPP